jgi:transcriptional regulator with XRE-family HTH domain
MAFAVTLRRLRLERFLSQAELAHLAGMHAITITRLEGGDQAPTTRTVRALAAALAVPPLELASPDEVAAARMLGRRRSRADGQFVTNPVVPGANQETPRTPGAPDREPLAALADPVETRREQGHGLPEGSRTDVPDR